MEHKRPSGLKGREMEVGDLTAVIGRRNLERCSACDRYTLKHEPCPHCAGKVGELRTGEGRLNAQHIVWALYEAKKTREAEMALPPPDGGDK